MSEFEKMYPKFAAVIKTIVYVINGLAFGGGFFMAVILILSAINGGIHFDMTAVKP